jgi:ABC-type multidrug transport system fused ATPase/permease subunit
LGFCCGILYIIAMKKIAGYTLEDIPLTAGGLVKFVARPYRLGLFWFFLLTLLGTLAWTASPVVVANMVSRLGGSRVLDSQIWWLVGIYFGLRFLDEILWRTAELYIRSFKPQMVERVRSALFAATLKRSYAYSVSSSSGQVGHWINQTRNTVNDLVDITIWTAWSRVIGLVISAIFLYMVHWLLGTIFAVWLILLFWYTTHRGKRFGQLVAMQSAGRRASGVVVDSVVILQRAISNAKGRRSASCSRSRPRSSGAGAIRGYRTLSPTS